MLDFFRQFFEVLIDISVSVSNFYGLSFYKDRGVLRTLPYVCNGTFWGKAKNFHITLEKLNILKISVKKTNFFIIERKIYVSKYDWGLKLQEFLYSLQSEKIISKTNSTTSVIKT